MSRSTIAARFESCLGSEESFTGLFLERTVGVCHLIQPPTEGQKLSYNKQVTREGQELETSRAPRGPQCGAVGSLLKLVAFCCLINGYLSSHLSGFHQRLEREVKELLPTCEALGLPQPEPIWQPSSFWLWDQVLGLMPTVGMTPPNCQTQRVWHTHVSWREQVQIQREDSRQLGILNMLGNASEHHLLGLLGEAVLRTFSSCLGLIPCSLAVHSVPLSLTSSHKLKHNNNNSFVKSHYAPGSVEDALTATCEQPEPVAGFKPRSLGHQSGGTTLLPVYYRGLIQGSLTSPTQGLSVPSLLRPVTC